MNNAVFVMSNMDCVESDAFGVDAADDAGFAFALFEREDVTVILRMIRVLPGDFIQVRDRPFVLEFRHAADLDKSPRVFRVDYEQ